MLKGGVIMDVTTPEQAKIAEEAGACAVMALERIPADIRAAGGVARMSDPKMIQEIQAAVSIPVMAKCRIGHFVEAQLLQAIEIDYIDESEVLSPADDVYHVNKREFEVPFVCGAKDLGEALRRINEGASMIRTKGEPGTGKTMLAKSHRGCGTGCIYLYLEQPGNDPFAGILPGVSFFCRQTPGIEYFETSTCRTDSFPFTVRILGRSVEIRLFRRRTDPVGTNSAYPSIFTPAMPYCVYEKLSGRKKIPGDSRGAPHIGEYGEITYLQSLS